MTELDLRSKTMRILECAKCDGLVGGEATGLRVELHCGYCGYDDVRELAGAVAAKSDDGATAYRGKKRDGGGRALVVDLSVTPKDPPTGVGIDELRAKWLEAKRALDAEATDEERATREFSALYVAAILANVHIVKLELVRARAVLETLLEKLVTPAYRAIVLARLARVAALSNAVDLADQWLDAAPRDLRIPEVASELRVAEAFVARAGGDAREVLRLVGEGSTAAEFVGPSRALAVALRIDAHETLGESSNAFSVYKDALVRGIDVQGVAAPYHLAPKTMKRGSKLGLSSLAILVAVLVAAAIGITIVLRLVFEDLPYGLAATAGAIASAAVLRFILRR